MKVRLIFESNDAALVVEAQSDEDKRLLAAFMGTGVSHEATLSVETEGYSGSQIKRAKVVVRPRPPAGPTHTTRIEE